MPGTVANAAFDPPIPERRRPTLGPDELRLPDRSADPVAASRRFAAVPGGRFSIVLNDHTLWARDRMLKPFPTFPE